MIVLDRERETEEKEVFKLLIFIPILGPFEF